MDGLHTPQDMAETVKPLILASSPGSPIFSMYWDLFRGWGAQGFPIPEVDFPSLEFSKCT